MAPGGPLIEWTLSGREATSACLVSTRSVKVEENGIVNPRDDRDLYRTEMNFTRCLCKLVMVRWLTAV